MNVTFALVLVNETQVASQANTVITMLPAKTHVYECYDGPDGVFR